MKIYRRRKVETLLNMTPLIDCVFLLLIFFLLTSTIIVDSGLEINLPESAHAASIDGGDIAVSLSEEGELSVNSAPSTLDDLTACVREARDRAERTHAILRADKNVRLGLLTIVTDLIKDAGITRIDIQTLRPPTPSHQGPTSEPPAAADTKDTSDSPPDDQEPL